MKYCDTCHSAYPDDFTACPRDQTALRAASDVPKGMILRGKYEVLEKIGAGGMAVVYRARHLAFGETVAIKVLSARLGDEDEFRRRFRTEAVVARRLSHPSAVRVEDLDTTEDGRPFIVMEYVEGRNLREVIRTEGALPLARAVEIARQVASALAAAHALGIVHRDIKPDNVLLTKDADGRERAKVLDFGISKVKEGALGDAVGHAPTATGLVVGTPQYLSPEQAMGRRGDEVDGRADLYSLGIVLYEMVTGRLPFPSDTAMGVILHHLQTAPTPPHLARPDLNLPPALSELLLKALEKDRDRRFGSAEEMRAALLALPTLLPDTPRPAVTAQSDIGELPTLPRVATPAPPPARGEPAAPAPGRSHAWVWAVVAIVSVVVFAGRDRRDDRRSSRNEEEQSAERRAHEEAEVRDARIQSEVKSLIAATPSVREEDIEVDVADGRVTLSGEARNQTAVEVAKALAGTLQGVGEVRSEIEVERPQGPPPHEDLLRLPRPPVPVTPQAAAAARELVAKGRRRLAEGDPRGALEAFKGAMDLDPTSSPAHEGLGEAIGQIAQRAIHGHPSPPPPPR